MTIKELETHIGSLIHIKTELYWHGGETWDGVPERFCILLAVGNEAELQPTPAARAWASDWRNEVHIDHYLQLLIDDKPQWVTLNAEIFEVVK